MNLGKLKLAIDLAFEAHKDQWRSGEYAVPYICHPLEVLTLLRYVGGVTNEDQLCAAVLHDVLEETDISYEVMRDSVGERAANLVKELTRVEPTAEETAGMSKDEIWAMRSQLLLDEISKMSPQAMAVKMCDRISNLREAKITKTEKKVKRYIAQTEKMLEIIPKKVSPSLWSMLAEQAKAS